MTVSHEIRSIRFYKPRPFSRRPLLWLLALSYLALCVYLRRLGDQTLARYYALPEDQRELQHPQEYLDMMKASGLPVSPPQQTRANILGLHDVADRYRSVRYCLLLPITGTLVLLLIQHWILPAKLLLSYQRVRSPKQASHVYVVPVAGQGQPSLIRLCHQVRRVVSVEDEAEAEARTPSESVADTVGETRLTRPQSPVLGESSEVESTSAIPKHVKTVPCTYAESAYFYFLQRKYTCDSPDLLDSPKLADAPGDFFHPHAQSESAPGAPEGQDDTSLPETSGWVRVDRYFDGSGLSSREHSARLSKFGQNRFLIPLPTISSLFMDTCMSPYFIFQIFSSAVFFLTNLKFTGAISLLLVLFSEGGSIYSRYTSLLSNRKMANPASLVRVLRDGKWELASSSTLVPGDIVRFTQRDVSEATVHAQKLQREAEERRAAKAAAAQNGTDPMASIPTIFQAFIKLSRLLFNPQYGPESYAYLSKEGKSFSNVMPCEMAVLDGGLVMDESLLTGESATQVKSPIFESREQKDGRVVVDVERDKVSIAFGGTKIAGVLAGSEAAESAAENGAKDSSPVTASGPAAAAKDDDTGDRNPAATLVVLRTSFETAQGQLIRKIVFDEERTASLNRDASLFMLVMIVVAVAAGIYTFVRGYYNQVAPLNKLILQALNVFIWAVPQSLPMGLSMLVAKGVEKLRKKNVYCTEPFTVITAGRVKTCAFDKTGTLCESKVNVLGVLLAEDCGTSGSEAQKPKVTPLDDLLAPSQWDLSCLQRADSAARPCQARARAALAVAACHSVVNINSTLCGDPLEVAALSASKDFRVCQEASSAGALVGYRDAEVKIVRRFAFNSELKRMSALVELPSSSPEQRGAKAQRPARQAGPAASSAGSLSEGGQLYVVSKGAPEVMLPLFKEESLGGAHRETLSRLNAAGYRVLSLGVKPVSAAPEGREAAERDLIFAGFLVTNSAIKKDAEPVVKALRASGHDCVVISGDSLQNVVGVARSCSIIRKGDSVYTLSAVEEEKGVPTCVFIHESDSQKTLRIGTSKNGQTISASAIPKNAVLCASNDEAFAGLLRHEELADRVIPRLTVFARSTPEQKALLVRTIQKRSPVLFVGDGSNDTEGLTAADAGIALLDSPAPSEDEKKGPDGRPLSSSQQGQQGRQAAPQLPYPSVMGPNNSLATAQQLMAEAQRRASRSGRSYTEEYRVLLQEQMAYRRALVARQRLRLVEKFNAQTGDGILALWSESLETEEETSGLPLGDACIAAPFTARNGALRSVIEVLRHGRMSLALTVMNYKTIAIECLVGAYMESVLMLDGVRFSDYELTIFSLLTAVMSMFIEKTSPAERLSRSPAPPSPFSLAVLGSAASQALIHALGIQAVYRAVGESGARVTLPFSTKFQPSALNTCISLFRMFMDLSTSLANYPGSPHMAPIWRQRTLLRILAIYLVILALLLFSLVPELNQVIGMAEIGEALQLKVLAIGVADVVLSVLVDKAFLVLFGPKLADSADPAGQLGASSAPGAK